MNERLVSVLSEVFNLRKEQIVPELNKEDVSRWDSLKQMDMVVSLEKEFCVAFEIEEILKMTSVGEIIQVLKNKKVDLED